MKKSRRLCRRSWTAAATQREKTLRTPREHHTSACSIGKSTNRFGFSMSSGSGVKSSYEPASSRFFISDAPLGTKRALRTGELCADLGRGGGDAARLGLSAAEAIILVTSLMPDSRAAMVDEGGVCGERRGVTRWRAAAACGGVWASWDRRHRRVCVAS